MSELAPAPLRAGDSDRSAVVDLLRAHHLDGRLTVEEFEERVGPAHLVVAVVTFPIGLIALALKNEDEVIVEIGEGLHGGTDLLAHGVGPLNAPRVRQPARLSPRCVGSARPSPPHREERDVHRPRAAGATDDRTLRRGLR